MVGLERALALSVNSLQGCASSLGDGVGKALVVAVGDGKGEGIQRNAEAIAESGGVGRGAGGGGGKWWRRSGDGGSCKEVTSDKSGKSTLNITGKLLCTYTYAKS